MRNKICDGSIASDSYVFYPMSSNIQSIRVLKADMTDELWTLFANVYTNKGTATCLNPQPI